VLRDLPPTTDPNLLVGPDRHSDAGVYRIGENLALVQTVDFFPPLTDDPYLFGQIAAANSLSDVYAMGGRPLTALNIVAYPDNELPLDLLSQIMRGGTDKAREAGAVVVGGHSVRDREIKYGLAVTGLVDPAKVVTNAGARPGDALILTKPIGSGALASAYRTHRVGERAWAACCMSMQGLNRPASEAMIAVGAHAATDVTGFGLLGHAGQMAQASNVTLEINSSDVPLLDQALALSRAGFVTRARATNRQWLGQRLKIEAEIEPAMMDLVLDAQTSGGLLIALAESALPQFGEAIKGADPAIPWKRIGRVRDQDDFWIRLR
jgi:selenide,water dikinase